MFESRAPALVHKHASLPEARSGQSALNTFAPSFLDLYNYADDRPLTVTDPNGQASKQQDLTKALLEKIAAAQGIGGGPSGVHSERPIGPGVPGPPLFRFREGETNQHNA